MVWPLTTLFDIGELVPERCDAPVRQATRGRFHERVAHSGPRAVREDEQAVGVGGAQEQARDLAGALRGLEGVLGQGVWGRCWHREGIVIRVDHPCKAVWGCGDPAVRK